MSTPLADREYRFASLPLRGRLALVVKHTRPLLDSMQAMAPDDDLVLKNLWEAVEIGEYACVHSLDAEEAAEIARLLSGIVSSRREPPERRVSANNKADARLGAIADVLNECAHICVRILLAVRALHTRTFEQASIELGEGFGAMLNAVDDVSALGTTVRLDAETAALLNSLLSRVDRDIVLIANLANASGMDNLAFMPSEVLVADYQTGHLFDRQDLSYSGPVPSSAELPPELPASAAGAGAYKAGLGISGGLVVLILSVAMKFVAHCNRVEHKQERRKPVQQQRARPAELPPRMLGQDGMRWSGLSVTAVISDSLTKAAAAVEAGDQAAAEAAMKRACEAFRGVPEVGTLDDATAETLVHLAWKCGDMRRSSNAAQAVAIYDTGISVARELLHRHGRAVDRSNVAALLNNNSIALHDLGRSAEALELLSEAVRLQTAALASDPASERYRAFLCNHQTTQIEVYLALGQWKEAAEAAKSSGDLWTDNKDELYKAACRLARVATAIRDATEDTSAHCELVRELTAEATAALSAARGPEMNLEDEIHKNDALRILGAPSPAAPR